MIDNTSHIGAAMKEWLRRKGIEKPFQEMDIKDSFIQEVGPFLSKRISRLEYRQTVLLVYVENSIVRSELAGHREELLRIMQNKWGVTRITNIELW